MRHKEEQAELPLVCSILFIVVQAVVGAFQSSIIYVDTFAGHQEKSTTFFGGTQHPLAQQREELLWLFLLGSQELVTG